jgi:hypothetical protein
MMTYKNYCNKRAAQKGQQAEEGQCCPLRMPIIGPILFSLFIFSPYFLPSSDSEERAEFFPNPVVDESPSADQQLLEINEFDKEDVLDAQSRHARNLGK